LSTAPVTTPDRSTAWNVAIRPPDVLPASATVEDVRDYFSRSEKVHLALVLDDGNRLLTTVLRTEVSSALRPDQPAVLLGRIRGRTIPRSLPADALEPAMDASGERRLAVVDTNGRLLGLVCRKASGARFCTDGGIEARRRGSNCQ